MCGGKEVGIWAALFFRDWGEICYGLDGMAVNVGG
jgi:hypothetical protein